MTNWEIDFVRDYGLTPAQVGKLRLLLSHIQSHSNRNLTAVTGADNIVNIHFRDSLILLSFPQTRKGGRLVDIGSGAGFPGLPLAVARPDAHFTLIDSRKGKSSFISETASLLSLDNVRVLCERAEVVGHSNLRESFHVAFARALGPLPVALELSLPLVRVGGFVLLQRGRRHNGDQALAESVSTRLGGRLAVITPLVPFPGASHLHVWTFEKVSPTPDRFPRRTGIPDKRPLS